MTSYLRRFFLIFIAFVCACTNKHNQFDNIVQQLSTYYGRPADSIKKHITITNSCSIPSLNLTLYFFSDSSNWQKYQMMYGQIIKDNSNNNCYIYSWIDHTSSTTPSESYFNCYQRKNNNKLAIYSFDKSSWQFQKLESVLNNLPIDVRKRINKNILDTFIQVTLLGRYSLENTHDSIHYTNSGRYSKKVFDSMFTNYYITYTEENYNLIGYRLPNMKLFKEFVDSLFDNGTLYVYGIPADHPEYMMLITVNDEFKNDSLAADYIKNNSNETALYKLKMYTFARNG